jgi:hypothetical protein
MPGMPPIVTNPGAGIPAPAIPSFLQALLNGESPAATPPAPGGPAPPVTSDGRSFPAPSSNSPLPSKVAVESVIGKLTRRHVGPNDKVRSFIFDRYFIYYHYLLLLSVFII